MHRTLILALALTSVGTPLAAQTAAGAAGAAGRTLAKAEVVASAENEFKQVDTDKNGQMTRTEIETFQRSRATATITARNKAIFAALDADKNGQISVAEFAKINAAPKVDAASVLAIDTNKDGQVSLAEHRTATLETFTKLDTNKDGSVTEAEIKALSTAAR